ncbi:MAG: hypothetical protein HQL53_03535 [Magnetococcales bacterium]|nr:hypothetical protein [Magnetococcales bacterium]
MSDLSMDTLNASGLATDLSETQASDLAAAISSGRCTFSSGEALFKSSDDGMAIRYS